MEFVLGACLQPLCSSPPPWGGGGCWHVLEVVDLPWERPPAMWGGLGYFSLALLLILNLL